MSENEKKAGMEEIMKDEPKYPERASDTPANPAAGVYAGPPPMPIAMTTYAGPNMMSNMNGAFMFGGQKMNIGSVQTPPQTVAPDSIFCERCGNPMPKNSRFCPECGTPVAQNATTDDSTK